VVHSGGRYRYRCETHHDDPALTPAAVYRRWVADVGDVLDDVEALADALLAQSLEIINRWAAPTGTTEMSAPLIREHRPKMSESDTEHARAHRNRTT